MEALEGAVRAKWTDFHASLRGDAELAQRMKTPSPDGRHRRGS